MDEERYVELFNQHVGIARKIFGSKLLQNQEAKEWANFAVQIAILKHDPSKGSMSTKVHDLARRYRNQFIREHRKWIGLPPKRGNKTRGNKNDTSASYKFALKGSYKGSPSYVVIHEKHCLEKTTYVAISPETMPDVWLDIQQCIEELEVNNPRLFGGRLSAIISGTLESKTDEEIAIELQLQRSLISKIKHAAIKKFKEKFGEEQ